MNPQRSILFYLSINVWSQTIGISIYVIKAKFVRIAAFANKTRNSIVIIQYNIGFNEVLKADNKQEIGECCVIISTPVFSEYITVNTVECVGVMVRLIKCLKGKFIEAELHWRCCPMLNQFRNT